MQLDIFHVIFSEESRKGMASIEKKIKKNAGLNSFQGKAGHVN